MKKIFKYLLLSLTVLIVFGCGSDDSDKDKPKETGKNKSVKVVMLYHDRCPPCEDAMPMWEEIKSEYPYVSFDQYNILNNPAKVAEYDVGNIPLFVLERDGQEVAREVGSEKTHLVNMIENNSI